MSVLTLALAKTHLNITVSTFDAELQTFIDSAEAVIGQHCGPLTSTPTTARVVPHDTRLPLPVTPAIDLTSVTPADGAALTLSDLYLNTAAGVVTYNAGTSFTARYYTVVYNAGRSSVPADLLLADKELVRHLWATQRGSTARPGPAGSDTPGAAHMLPFRVSELISPHMQYGFA